MLQRIASNIIACFLLTTAAHSQNLVPDTTFGQQGLVLTSFSNLEATISALAVQADQKIVACGSIFNGSSNRLAIVRYNTDGTLDRTFGKKSKVLIPVGSYMENESNSIQILTDGSILVAATDGVKSDQNIVILRFLANGTPDESFGTEGIVRPRFPNKTVANALVVQPDGKIIVGGKISEDFSLDYTDFLVARFLPDGSPDESFGVLGHAIINFGTQLNRHVISEDVVNVIKLQPDGKILAGGYTFAEPSNSTSDFALLRLNFDGSTDTGFGRNGRVITDFGKGETAQSIELLDDGKIILSGIYFYNDDAAQKVCLAKYNPNGTLDIAFGNSGKVVTDLNESTTSGYSFSSILQNDGKLLVSGYVNNDDADMMVIRYLADGEIDSSFGVDGRVLADFGENETSFASSLQPDGSVLLGGSSQGSSYRSFLLTKFKPESQSTFAVGTTSFSVSPNPFTQFIDVEFNLNTNDAVVVEIMDASGNSIKSVVPNQPCGCGCISERITLPESLSEGMYYLNVSAGADFSTVEIRKRK